MRPWRDNRGRLSLFKLTVFVLLFVPGAWTVAAFALDDLGSRPLNEAIHQVGLWTIRLMYLSLAITPARQVLQWPGLVLVRRMVGVAAFCYAVVHLSLYFLDQSFDLVKTASEIGLRFYLAIGFAALLGLSALAVTSTDGMTRRLGGRRWQRLHQTLYAIGFVATIHYFLQAKLDVFEPIFIAGFYGWLMGYRVIARFRRDGRVPPWTVGALGLAAALLTALGEAVYFWLKMGISPTRVLFANLSQDVGVRPAWIVLATAIAVTIVALVRPLVKRQSKLRWRPA
jgi:sulfoxide reductase heme-binding subunit YedZ